MKGHTVHDDILGRLRIDSGRRTLGQLLQNREAAAHEIERLRSEMDRLIIGGTTRVSQRTIKAMPETSVADRRKPPFRAGTLIRIAEVCELLGIGRSTVYKRLSERTFPEPVRLGPRTVRSKIDEIEAWRNTHAAKRPG